MEYVSIWSVIVASIVAFAVSALWYSPILFGKEWMSLMKIGDKEISEARAKGMTWHYVGQFIATLITFIVMAFAVAAFDANGRDGAMIGLIAWIGFILPVGVSAALWDRKPLKLVLINVVCTLVTLIIGGAIIGAW